MRWAVSWAMAPLELVEHVKRFALVIHKWIALRKGPQTDALA